MLRQLTPVSNDPAIYSTRSFAVIVKPRAVTRMNECLALYHACVWGDYALNSALGMELQRGTMLTSYESVVIELTGRQSGDVWSLRCLGRDVRGCGGAKKMMCSVSDRGRQSNQGDFDTTSFD